MAYDAIAQREHDPLADDSPRASPEHRSTRFHSFQPLPQMDVDKSRSPALFMEQEQEQQHELGSLSAGGLGNRIHSTFSRESKGSYELVEDDSYSQDSRAASPQLSPRGRGVKANARPAEHPSEQSPSHGQATVVSYNHDKKIPKITAPQPRPIAPDAPLRTASGRKAPLRHPTPDLHTLQGALMANVEHLEKTAEKLSMTSSIEDAIKQMHDDQKRSQSRRSSLMASPIEVSIPTRQFSNSGSIVEVNNAARSGGFSPGGFSMISPRDLTSASGRGRSSSKGSRFSSRPEPELEGRPLDSFVNFSFSGGSPALSRAASIAEYDEETLTMTRQPINPPTELRISNPEVTHDRPTTSASMTTIEQAQKLFSDFDGEHYEPLPATMSDIGQPKQAIEGGQDIGSSQLQTEGAPEGRESQAGSRVSSGNRLSMGRPLSYADPSTGQQMVYYPAPVPMMLNLPQKISKLSPGDAARAKRRSQVLSSLPLASRKSAVWLPDVLEDEADEAMQEDDPLQHQEYLAQHQRATMGGRRSTQDLQHLPPQLRASAFFEVPGATQLVEVKEDSAVKTLDSILDASAFAPVSAFTDHLIAGRLGAEVYGTAHKRASKPMNALAEFGTPHQVTKRKSLAHLLRPRRASSSELLGGENHRLTMSTALGLERDDSVKSGDRGEDEAHLENGEQMENEDEEEGEELYQGAPTTLLAELQLRKQRQKERTRPLASAYPNGMHSTLLELDTVAQVEKKWREKKRVNLAWEEPNANDDDFGNEDDEDVPLAMLFPAKSRAHQDQSRPMGLMERREMEDNEPLSRRRDRLQGRPRAMPRASTMMGGFGAEKNMAEDEGETLAQRVQRLKAEGGTVTGLPPARPVSGDFASEMMSQFGGDLMKEDIKGKGKATDAPAPPEEEETLGQRRKRLQAEREAREKEVAAGINLPADDAARPELKKRHSLADILSVHPAAGAGSRTSSYGKPLSGLLALHEKQNMQRSSTMLGLQNQQPIPPANMRTQSFGGNAFMNGGTMNVYPQQNMYAQQQYPVAGVGYTNPYASMGYGVNAGGMTAGYSSMGGYQNPLAAQMLQMQQKMASMGVEPLNQGQVDMVERWRQSVMQ